MNLEDRRDYPGSFLYSGSAFDPHEARALGVPIEDAGYYPSDTRAPTMADYFNPMSQDLGYLNISGAAERDRLAAEAAIAKRKAEMGESPSPSGRTPEEQRQFDQNIEYNERMRKRRESQRK